MDNMIFEHELSKIKIENLIFDKSNPNIMNQEQMAGLRKAMERFGYLSPIIVDQNNQIADGEHRVLVYKEFGLTEIPCYRVSFSDDTERRLLRQTMNKLRGQHDFSMDADEMALIYESNKMPDLSGLIAQQEETLKEFMLKYKPELPFGHEDDEQIDKIIDEQLKKTSPDTQLGDVIQLGSHRLICADCTDKRSIDKLINGKKPALVFTDPPYNIDFGYDDYEDKLKPNEYEDFIRTWFNHIESIGIRNAIITPGPRNTGLWYKTIGEPSDIGIWRKPNARSGASAFYFRRCEPILFYGKFDNKRTDDFFDYSVGVDQATHDAESQASITSEDHAPAKPTAFVADLLWSYSKPLEIILDLFMGSGSTLIACEKTGRICYGVELNPRYCDVIIKRWENYTKNKAVRT